MQVQTSLSYSHQKKFHKKNQTLKRWLVPTYAVAIEVKFLKYRFHLATASLCVQCHKIIRSLEHANCLNSFLPDANGFISMSNNSKVKREREKNDLKWRNLLNNIDNITCCELERTATDGMWASYSEIPINSLDLHPALLSLRVISHFMETTEDSIIKNYLIS